MRGPHTHFRKGAHVFVILKSGEKFEDVFEDRKSGAVILRTLGRLAIERVRSMSFRQLGRQ